MIPKGPKQKNRRQLIRQLKDDTIYITQKHQRQNARYPRGQLDSWDRLTFVARGDVLGDRAVVLGGGQIEHFYNDLDIVPSV